MIGEVVKTVNQQIDLVKPKKYNGQSVWYGRNLHDHIGYGFGFGSDDWYSHYTLPVHPGCYTFIAPESFDMVLVPQEDQTTEYDISVFMNKDKVYKRITFLDNTVDNRRFILATAKALGLHLQFAILQSPDWTKPKAL